MALFVSDTLWFKEGDEEVRFKDLSPEEAQEWLYATQTDDIVGRTVVGKILIQVPGQYEPEPATLLVLDDGMVALFVHPSD
jgi:hypothetical protein